jgi:hypothetical protein
VKQSDIHINIEEIILEGFSPSEKYRIAEAIRTELTRLVQVRGLPAAFNQNGEIQNLPAQTIHLTRNQTAPDIGSKVAQSIYGGLKS